MDLKIDKKAQFIIDKLNSNGFEGYIVGGCVRDLIIGNTPKDYDITTTARPNQIIEVFKEYKTILTGIKYGTVTVIIDKTPFEVTTFRAEGKYINSRRPETVNFLSDIKEDLYRRDFTINSLAYANGKLIDLYGGVDDIKNKTIRAVGNIDEKFKEDALRILRAYRFMGRYNWEIEEKTKKAMLDNMPLLNNISKERILTELREIFESGMDIYKMDFIPTLFPIINKCFNTYQNNIYHMQTVGDHIYHTFNNIENKFDLKMTMLLHDIGKVYAKTTDKNNIDHFYMHGDISREMSTKILNDFKFDKKTKDKILILIENHDKYMMAEKEYIKRSLNKFGKETFLDLIKVRIADDMAKNQDLVKANIEIFNKTTKLTKKILEDKEPYKLSHLDINGNEIQNLGYEGKDVGMILNRLLDIVIKDKTLNKKDKLVEIIKKNKKS